MSQEIDTLVLKLGTCHLISLSFKQTQMADAIWGRVDIVLQNKSKLCKNTNTIQNIDQKIFRKNINTAVQEMIVGLVFFLSMTVKNKRLPRNNVKKRSFKN